VAAKKRSARGKDARPTASARLPARPKTRIVPVRIGHEGRETTFALGKGFEVTGSGRDRRSRGYTIGGADEHMGSRDIDKLREIGRDLDRNSCLIHGILDRFVDNVVGDTFGFRPTTGDPQWNDAAHAWMVEQMGPECDVRGLLDFHSILRTALRAIGTDGDVLLVHAPGRKLQAIEAHQVGTPWDASGRNIVNGVEMDKAGRPVAFHVASQTYNGRIARNDDAQRIPAEHVIWPAYRTRFTQTRGLPVLTAALAHYDRLDAYIDNESLAAEIDACLAFFVQQESPDYGDSIPGQESATSDNQLGESGDDTTVALQQIRPGMIARLQPGEKVQPFGATRPGQTFEPYVVTSLRIVGAALGYPLELVLLDFSRTTYSSARAALLQAYRVFRCWQQWLIRTVCAPIYRRWIAQGIAAGELTHRDDALQVRWFPPQWAWVDPLKEVLALKEAVALGTATLTDEVERQGRTMAEFVAERQGEIGAFATAGIPSTGMTGATVSGSVDPYDVAKGNGDKDDD